MINVMIIVYSIFIPVLLLISGFAKAVMDLSEEGKIKFKPSRYWIKSMSSPNKWKDNYTEAMLVLQDMQQASTRNDNMKNMVIEQGKYKILNQ